MKRPDVQDSDAPLKELIAIKTMLSKTNFASWVIWNKLPDPFSGAGHLRMILKIVQFFLQLLRARGKSICCPNSPKPILFWALLSIAIPRTHRA